MKQNFVMYLSISIVAVLVITSGVLIAVFHPDSSPSNNNVTVTTPPSKTCVTAGCSGQLCVDISKKDTPSTCEYRASYACYHSVGVCEVQSDGTCGWSPTYLLKTCIDKADKAL